jgi:hypothetical protein
MGTLAHYRCEYLVPLQISIILIRDQTILYAYPTYMPYWPSSTEAMEIANSLVADVFVPHSKVSDQCASYIVSSSPNSYFRLD